MQNGGENVANCKGKKVASYFLFILFTLVIML